MFASSQGATLFFGKYKQAIVYFWKLIITGVFYQQALEADFLK